MQNSKLLILSLISLLLLSSCSYENNNIYTGIIDSNKIDISSEIGGMLNKVYAQEGDSVKKGQILAIIDTTKLKIQKNKLEANLKEASNALEQTKNPIKKDEIRKVRTKITQQNTIIEQLQKNYDYSLNLYEQNKILYENGSISKDIYDNNSLKKDNDYYNLKQAKENLKYLNHDLNLLILGSTKEEVNISQARYEKAYYDLESLNYDLSKENIIATKDGIIESLNFDEGEYITAYSHFATINDISSLYTYFYIEEKNLSKINIGDKLKLKLDYQNKDLEGEVIYISSYGEFTPKNIESKENKQEVVFKIKVKINENLKSGQLIDLQLERNK